MKTAAGFILASGFLLFSSAVRAQNIIINEIMYNPKGSDLHSEWIELYNASGDAVNLAGWRFFDGSNHRLTAWRGGLEVESGGFVILASSASRFIKQNPDCGAAVIDTVMNLKNTSCTVALIDSFGVVADSLAYHSSWNNNVEGKSIEKKNPLLDPRLKSSFHESLDFGGTPGRSNSTGRPDSEIGGLSDNVYPVITEAAPSERTDFVELYFGISGIAPDLYFYQGESCFKEVKSRVVRQDEVWVIWFEPGQDEETDLNGGGFIDLYSLKSGLTATDNVLSVRDSAGVVRDVVCWSNMDKDAFSFKKSYDLVCAQGAWLPPVTSGVVEDYEAGCFDARALSPGRSVNRKFLHNGGYSPGLPGRKEEWFTANTVTPGFAVNRRTKDNFDCLEVQGPNPFSPTDPDPAKRSVWFSYKTGSTSAVKNLRVFDVNGREKSRLISDDITSKGTSLAGCPEGVASWDGYDDSGGICPVGIYIVFFESRDPLSGAKLKSKKTCVLGKKLKK